jgi:phospholipase C
MRHLARGALLAALAATMLPGIEQLARSAASPIQHVVIINEENHAFNDVLGKLCVEQAKGQIVRAGLNMPCTGTTKGVLATGAPYKLTLEPNSGFSVAHNPEEQAIAIHGGKMDGFSRIGGCKGSSVPPHGCLTQFDPLTGDCGNGSQTCIPNMATYAENYAISDATFELRQTPSWAGHMVLASASIERFSGFNPDYPTKQEPGTGWGCDSGKVAPWIKGNGSTVQVPSCVPDRSGSMGSLWSGWTGTKPYFEPTIFDRLDNAGLSWRIYSGEYHWSICPTFYECFGSSQSSNVVDNQQLFSDVRGGFLPAVSIVTPTTTTSAHPPSPMSNGDNFIGQVVSAIQAKPSLWASTAIFVTFDDCGCFYDPVNPIQYDREWGVRVPLIIISPYARAGYTDSVPATFASLLTFIEHTFSLKPLNPCATVDKWNPVCTDDVLAPATVNHGVTNDYSNAFDFTQTPLPTVPAVVTHLTQAQRRWQAAHPHVLEGAET